MTPIVLRKLPAAVFLTGIFTSALFSQNAKCDLIRPRLAELRDSLVGKFQAKDYDKAYSIGGEMVRLGEENCEGNDDLMLSLNLNVAQIQVKRKKFDVAQKIYDQNLEVAERVYGANSVDFQKYTEDLLALSTNAVDTKKFETYALKLLEAKQQRFGDPSVEYLSQLTKVARFYAAWKKFDIAESYFLKAMDVADRLGPEIVTEKEKAVNRYRVFLITRYGEAEGLSKGETLMKRRYPDFPIREKTLNGVAYSLPRPVFSAQARNVGANGEVLVEIKIDQQGKVISAVATTGHPLLRREAESAARLAKFLPTFLKGKSVEVTGVIKYRFAE